MNTVNIIGRTCGQPTIRYVGPKNTPVAEFALAYDDPQNKDAAGKAKSYFFQIIIWGTKAEIAHQYMVKGQKVGITGRLHQEEFIPKGGDKFVQKTRIVADQFDLLEKPKSYDADKSYDPDTTEQEALT